MNDGGFSTNGQPGQLVAGQVPEEVRVLEEPAIEPTIEETTTEPKEEDNTITEPVTEENKEHCSNKSTRTSRFHP